MVLKYFSVHFRFALLTANIFLREDVKVHLFSKMVPTPYVVKLDFHVLYCIASSLAPVHQGPENR